MSFSIWYCLSLGLPATSATAIALARGPEPLYCSPYQWIECVTPADASVYFCENTNFQPPCFNFLIERYTNGQLYGWKSEEHEGIWPAANSNEGSWSVGSLGPSKGITVTVYDPYFNTTANFTYPGSPDVGPEWRDSIWSFSTSWYQPCNPFAPGEQCENAKKAKIFTG